MTENLKKIINRFLLDEKIFERLKSLVYENDIIEYNTILGEIHNTKDNYIKKIWEAQLKIFCEKKYKELSGFIPLKLENIDEITLFIELFFVIYKYDLLLNQMKFK